MKTSTFVSMVIKRTTLMVLFFVFDDSIDLTAFVQPSLTQFSYHCYFRNKKTPTLKSPVLRIMPLFEFLQHHVLIIGPQREKTCLLGFANNTGADQPAHPRSLISAFVIRFLGSDICKLPTGDFSIF